MFSGKEPAVFFKVIEEVIRAGIPMALIFGWVQWTEAQTGAVMLFVGVAVGGASMLLTRSQTTPTETANKQIEVAVNQPSGTSVERVIEITKKREGE